MSEKIKCFITGPEGCWEDTKRVSEILENVGYEVSTPFEMLGDGRPLIDFTEEEIRSYRNRQIEGSGHLICLEGWQNNYYARADHVFAYSRGIGISYAAEMELLRAHKVQG